MNHQVNFTDKGTSTITPFQTEIMKEDFNIQKFLALQGRKIRYFDAYIEGTYEQNYIGLLTLSPLPVCKTV